MEKVKNKYIVWGKDIHKVSLKIIYRDVCGIFNIEPKKEVLEELKNPNIDITGNGKGVRTANLLLTWLFMSTFDLKGIAKKDTLGNDHSLDKMLYDGNKIFYDIAYNISRGVLKYDGLNVMQKGQPLHIEFKKGMCLHDLKVEAEAKIKLISDMDLLSIIDGICCTNIRNRFNMRVNFIKYPNVLVISNRDTLNLSMYNIEYAKSNYVLNEMNYGGYIVHVMADTFKIIISDLLHAYNRDDIKIEELLRYWRYSLHDIGYCEMMTRKLKAFELLYDVKIMSRRKDSKSTETRNVYKFIYDNLLETDDILLKSGLYPQSVYNDILVPMVKSSKEYANGECRVSKYGEITKYGIFPVATSSGNLSVSSDDFEDRLLPVIKRFERGHGEDLSDYDKALLNKGYSFRGLGFGLYNEPYTPLSKHIMDISNKNIDEDRLPSVIEMFAGSHGEKLSDYDKALLTFNSENSFKSAYLESISSPTLPIGIRVSPIESDMSIEEQKVDMPNMIFDNVNWKYRFIGMEHPFIARHVLYNKTWESASLFQEPSGKKKVNIPNMIFNNLNDKTWDPWTLTKGLGKVFNHPFVSKNMLDGETWEPWSSAKELAKVTNKIKKEKEHKKLSVFGLIAAALELIFEPFETIFKEKKK